MCLRPGLSFRGTCAGRRMDQQEPCETQETCTREVKKPFQQYRLGMHWLGYSYKEKDLEALIHSKLNMSQKHALAAKKAAAFFSQTVFGIVLAGDQRTHYLCSC